MSDTELSSDTVPMLEEREAKKQKVEEVDTEQMVPMAALSTPSVPVKSKKIPGIKWKSAPGHDKFVKWCEDHDCTPTDARWLQLDYWLQHVKSEKTKIELRCLAEGCGVEVEKTLGRMNGKRGLACACTGQLRWTSAAGHAKFVKWCRDHNCTPADARFLQLDYWLKDVKTSRTHIEMRCLAEGCGETVVKPLQYMLDDRALQCKCTRAKQLASRLANPNLFSWMAESGHLRFLEFLQKYNVAPVDEQLLQLEYWLEDVKNADTKIEVYCKDCKIKCWKLLGEILEHGVNCLCNGHAVVTTQQAFDRLVEALSTRNVELRTDLQTFKGYSEFFSDREGKHAFVLIPCNCLECAKAGRNGRFHQMYRHLVNGRQFGCECPLGKTHRLVLKVLREIVTRLGLAGVDVLYEKSIDGKLPFNGGRPFDCVLVERSTGRWLLVVEVDDKSHFRCGTDRIDTQYRSAEKEDVLRAAGIALARLHQESVWADQGGVRFKWIASLEEAILAAVAGTLSLEPLLLAKAGCTDYTRASSGYVMAREALEARKAGEAARACYDSNAESDDGPTCPLCQSPLDYEDALCAVCVRENE